MKRCIGALLLVLSTLILGSTPVLAWDEMAAVTNGYGTAFYYDAVDFSDVIDAYSGWNESLTSYTPYASWWKEESEYGYDDSYADDNELSLLVAHGNDNGGSWTITQIVFPNGGNLDDPDTVRLGYDSPDNDGVNIWSFFITCNLFKDSSYPYWLDSLTGTHMLLSFKNSVVWISGDLKELGQRLTGTGGFSQETVQGAFFSTFVDNDDEAHYYNVGRILAENDSVATYDEIDSFDTQTTVDSTKTIISCGPYY